MQIAELSDLSATASRAKRRAAAALAGIAVIAALAGSGCSNSTSSSSSSTPSTPAAAPSAPSGASTTVTYAIIPKMLNNPVFKLAELGADKAAKDLEKKNPGTTYNIIYESSQTGKANEQAQTIDTLANKGVNGMSISTVDVNAVKKPIADAVGDGIPVICFDSDAVGSERTSLYSVSDEEIGKELGNELVAAVGGKANMKGEIAVISGQSSAPNLQGRVKGVLDALDAQDYPGITFLPILYCDDNTPKSIDEIRTTMQAHPKLRGWIFVGGWPLFASHALDGVDPKITAVVSMDSLPQEWPYLKSGQVYCLVGQKYFGWGEQSVDILEGIRTGANKNPPPFVDSGYDLLFSKPTAAQRALAHGNVSVYSEPEYEKQWAVWNAGS
jgi:ribose transport system substrate-binding protein